jgi:hypothetical protein
MEIIINTPVEDRLKERIKKIEIIKKEIEKYDLDYSDTSLTLEDKVLKINLQTSRGTIFYVACLIDSIDKNLAKKMSLEALENFNVEEIFSENYKERGEETSPYQFFLENFRNLEYYNLEKEFINKLEKRILKDIEKLEKKEKDKKNEGLTPSKVINSIFKTAPVSSLENCYTVNKKKVSA